MKSNFSLLIFSIFIALFSISIKAQNVPGKSSDILTNNKINGAWRINYAESDDPFLKMQTLLQNKLFDSANQKISEVEIQTWNFCAGCRRKAKRMIGEASSFRLFPEFFQTIFLNTDRFGRELGYNTKSGHGQD